MALSSFADQIPALVASAGHWISKNVLHPPGLTQAGLAVLAYLLAWFLARKICRFQEGKSQDRPSHAHFRFSPENFVLVVRYVFWLFALWFLQVLFVFPLEVDLQKAVEFNDLPVSGK